MYQITVDNLSMLCASQKSALAWVDFFLDQGHAPQITYKGADDGK